MAFFSPFHVQIYYDTTFVAFFQYLAVYADNSERARVCSRLLLFLSLTLSFLLVLELVTIFRIGSRWLWTKPRRIPRSGSLRRSSTDKEPIPTPWPTIPSITLFPPIKWIGINTTQSSFRRMRESRSMTTLKMRSAHTARRSNLRTLAAATADSWCHFRLSSPIR